jgi:malto-oligosyltrehalose trehalohydrolase
MLREMAQRIRAAVEPGRHVHLVLEHDENAAAHLTPPLYDAQWNDDGHHALHVLLTGEEDGYYGDYAKAPAALLARCLAQGFAYQGEASRHRGGLPRGTPSGHLPPTAFVLFLQNHDQIGNRALGERLSVLAPAAALDAARALLLLCPQIPMLFMGEEWASRQPFLYFTDFTGSLADAVREGRAREFARFAAFAGDAGRSAIPDPNAATSFAESCLDPAEATAAPHAAALAHTQALLALRHAAIVPRLPGAAATAADVIGPSAVRAGWRLGDGSSLRVLCNLAGEAVAIPAEAGTPLHATPPDAADAIAAGALPGFSTIWFLDRVAGA